MKLECWRRSNGLTLAEVGEALGFASSNPARGLQLIERGERKADANIVAAIELLTEGSVTPRDMHETRLDWLKLNKPQKFPTTNSSSEAIE